MSRSTDYSSMAEINSDHVVGVRFVQLIDFTSERYAGWSVVI